MSGPWEKFQAPAEAPAPAPAEGPWSKFQAPTVSAPKPEDWQARVKPIDLGNGKASVQRDDGGVWFGPEQGNTGKPGWFDAKGMRLGDAPGQRPGFMDRQINGGLDQQRHPIASVIRQMGDIPVVPGAIQIEGSPVNGPTLAGFAKGASSLVTAPLKAMGQAAQYVRNHDTRLFPMAGYDQHNPEGITASTNIPDDLAQKIYSENFNRNISGEVAGQVAPFLATGGASASGEVPQVLSAAQRVKAALMSLPGVLPKASATGAGYNALLAPHAPGQTNEQFMAQAADDAKFGGKVGFGLGAVAPAIETVSALRQKLGTVADTPSVSELLDKLGIQLKGKTPGNAAKDAAWDQYNAAWDEFKQAIAPVDEAAPSTGIDYSKPVETLKAVLGIGKKRSPAPMEPESEAYLRKLLANLEEAGAADGGVDNSAAGAVDTIKQLGAAQRRLSMKHGETESRKMLETVRDSIIGAIDESNAGLGSNYANARQIFAKKVAPLFDKSEGGNFLTQLRDTPTPDDWIGSGNQGSLTRMKADKAAIVAKGSAPEPLLYSYLHEAVNRANGNPGSFVTSIEKALPAVQSMANEGTITPEMLTAFQGLSKVARTAKFAGWLANMGITGAGTAIGGPLGGAAAAGTSIGLHFKPGYSAPGIIWSLMQAPSTRKLLTFASKLPAGSPELELISRDLAKTATAAPAAGKAFSNVQPFNPLPAAADTGTTDERASN